MSSALAPASGDGIFDFFALPRELRDNIYDMLSEEKEANIIIRFRMQAPLQRARFINRQFKSEYDERCLANMHNMHLMIQDPNGKLRLNGLQDCPRFATRARHLHINWANLLHGCQPSDHKDGGSCTFMEVARDRLRCLRPYIDRNFPGAQVHLTVLMTADGCKKQMVELVNQFLSISSLELVDRSCLQMGVKMHYAIWTRERGLIKDSMDKDGARKERLAAYARLRVESEQLRAKQISELSGASLFAEVMS